MDRSFLSKPPLHSAPARRGSFSNSSTAPDNDLFRGLPSHTSSLGYRICAICEARVARPQDKACPRHRCAAPNCGELPVRTGSIFCISHECSTSRCSAERLPLKLQCSAHTCHARSCSFEKASEETYCWMHACAIEDCTREKKTGRGGTYCPSHSCRVEMCREPSEYPHSVFCRRHSTHRDAMPEVMPPSQPFGYPSSPLPSSSRRRAPSFSDPGFLPSTPLPSFEPYTSSPSFDAPLPSTSYGFDAQPPPRARRTFSRSMTWPQSMQELPPLSTSYDGPPRAFRDLLQGSSSSSRSSSSNRPPNRPYY